MIKPPAAAPDQQTPAEAVCYGDYLMNRKIEKTNKKPESDLESRITATNEMSGKSTDVVSKRKIDRAFRLMRDRGLITDQNYPDKLSATICLSVLSAQALMRGEYCLGYAYYEQADEGFRRAGENFWIGYGPSMDEGLNFSCSFEDIAEIVCECLRLAEVPFRWEGGTGRRVEVLQNTKYEESGPNAPPQRKLTRFSACNARRESSGRRQAPLSGTDSKQISNSKGEN